MKKPNITPGPWNLALYNYRASVTQSGLPVADLQACHHVPYKANARLIAAAPQMAEALNDLTAAFETLWRITCKDLPNDTLEAAKAALLAAGYTE